MSTSHATARKPNIIRRLWIARRLVAAALVVGTLLWFILTNNQTVTVHIPFGLGNPSASVGLVVLVSAMAGSLATALIFTIVWAVLRYRPIGKLKREPLQEITEERPPVDYAAQTREGFSDAPWTAR